MLRRIKDYMLGMQLTCKEVNAFILAYLEGEVEPRIARRFESHIAICINCRTYLEQYQQTVDLLGETTVLDPPPELLAMTKAFLEKEIAQSKQQGNGKH